MEGCSTIALEKSRKKTLMPISYLDVPPRIRVEANEKLVKDIHLVFDEAYHVPDTRIFIREWPLENVSQDGRLDSQPA